MDNLERLAGRLAQGMSRLDAENPEEISGSASLVSEVAEALASSEPRTWSDPPRSPRDAGQAKTALVVDALSEDRAALRQMLESAGYSVFEAESGAEALALFDRCPTPMDVMLTDVLLQDMSGRELAERGAAQKPGTSVIYMSGYADDEVLRCGVLSPGALTLRKPVTPEALKQRLSAVAEAQYA